MGYGVGEVGERAGVVWIEGSGEEGRGGGGGKVGGLRDSGVEEESVVGIRDREEGGIHGQGGKKRGNSVAGSKGWGSGVLIGWGLGKGVMGKGGGRRQGGCGKGMEGECRRMLLLVGWMSGGGEVREGEKKDRREGKRPIERR